MLLSLVLVVLVCVPLWVVLRLVSRLLVLPSFSPPDPTLLLHRVVLMLLSVSF